MKITYRIPSKDPYGYVEFEVEGPTETASFTGAIDEMESLMSHKKGGEGLTDKELDLIIQNMCLGKTTTNGTELWSKATPTQKAEINRLKRALSRIKAKGGEPEMEASIEDTY